ncbi:MAG: TetR/AcrR family transcriptional regulator [Steroidobacteraceae bacterium]|jgi:AcrR family transcriptional regulator|nr:TetR/AcrR family transcriptional regulator [Steroidobacteraceae bacterium]
MDAKLDKEPGGVPRINHRTVVGRRRRAQTEAKILEAALKVFAEKGPDVPVIEDFIQAAGIARGTFYNYFKSTEELLQATSDWLTDDIVESIETEIGRIRDPVRRHATGLRLWMRKAEMDRAWCAFVARVWFRGGFATFAPLRDIRMGIKKGRFHCPSPEVGFDMSMGTVRQAMIRLAEEDSLRNYGDSVTIVILQGLGLEPAMIEEVMAGPLPTMRRPSRAVSN